MRIGLDLDGTLTNFEKFVLDNAPEYMKKKYNMDIININGYDVDQVFDIENVLIEKGYLKEQASIESQKILSTFWEKFYLKYCLATPFRNGARETVKKLIDDGHEVFIFTSRKKTCDEGLLGEFVRKTTRLQFLLNGLSYKNLILLPSDEEKLEVVRKYNIDIMVDDKPELISLISEFADVICINSNYNIHHDIPDKVFRLNSYENEIVYNAVNQIIKKKQRPLSVYCSNNQNSSEHILNRVKLPEEQDLLCVNSRYSSRECLDEEKTFILKK